MDVVPAADPELAGHVPVGVFTCEVDAAHVRAVPENTGEARAAALLSGLDHLNHFTVLRVILSK